MRSHYSGLTDRGFPTEGKRGVVNPLYARTLCGVDGVLVLLDTLWDVEGGTGDQ
jgi:hypothetical protein